MQKCTRPSLGAEGKPARAITQANRRHMDQGCPMLGAPAQIHFRQSCPSNVEQAVRFRAPARGRMRVMR